MLLRCDGNYWYFNIYFYLFLYDAIPSKNVPALQAIDFKIDPEYTQWRADLEEVGAAASRALIAKHADAVAAAAAIASKGTAKKVPTSKKTPTPRKVPTPKNPLSKGSKTKVTVPLTVAALPTTTVPTVALPTTTAPIVAALPTTTAPDAGATIIAGILLPLLAPTALELKAASDEAIADAFRRVALDTAGNHHERFLTSLVGTVVGHPNVILAVAAARHLLAIFDDVSPYNFLVPQPYKF